MDRALLTSLSLVSGVQRLTIASVPPVTTLIAALTGLDAFSIGLATAVTGAVMAVGAPLSASLAHRVSREWVVVLGAALVVAGAAVRGIPPLTITLFIGSILGGLGASVVGTMIPGIIAERLPRMVGPAVGATTFALTLGAVVVATLTVPIALAYGVPVSLAVWALPALAVMLVWLPFTRGTRVTPGGRVRMPWRSSSAWLSATLMTLLSITFLVCLAWVAPSFTAAGVALEQAGFLLGAVTLGNMTGALVAPMLARGGGDRRPMLVLASILTAIGGAYLALGFTTGALVVMLLLGLGLGGGFGVALALLIDLGASPRATAALSALTFFVAYLASSPAPAVAGALHDALGGFASVWWLLVVLVALAQVPVAMALGPRRARSVVG